MNNAETTEQPDKHRVSGSVLMRLVRLLFRCPPDRKLIFVWKTKDEVQALGQVVTTTTVSIGSLKVASWVTYFTPVSDWRK
jgi:hypothetical protein